MVNIVNKATGKVMFGGTWEQCFAWIRANNVHPNGIIWTWR
jgi:hypothetical protein